MNVYFNENDRYASHWLKALYPEAHVDSRSIVDVQPRDVASFRRCHYFGGIGGWELALALADWPVDREVWTGSCPCQPFSAAGKRKGKADARHLWPEFFRLIIECMPSVVFGEQVASKDGRDWLTGVRSDLEALGYAFGAADLRAAGTGEEAEGWIVRGDSGSWERIVLGAPHIRQRLFWVATLGMANAENTNRRSGSRFSSKENGWPVPQVRGCGPTGRLGDADSERFSWWPERNGESEQSGFQAPYGPDALRSSQWLGDASRRGCGISGNAAFPRDSGHAVGPGWSGFDVIPCRDGKSRRIESGAFPLVTGLPFRLADGRSREGVSRAQVLKGIGNSIVPALAAEFIRAFLDSGF